MKIAAKVLAFLSSASTFLLIRSMSSVFDPRIEGLTASSGRLDVDIDMVLADKPFLIQFDLDLGDLLGSAVRFFKEQIKKLIGKIFGNGRSGHPLTEGSSWAEGGVEQAAQDAPSIAELLANPAVRKMLAGSRIYNTTNLGVPGIRSAALDMQYLPEGLQGFLDGATEFKGDIPHRTKWSGGSEGAKGRTGAKPVLWQKYAYQGEDLLNYLDSLASEHSP